MGMWWRWRCLTRRSTPGRSFRPERASRPMYSAVSSGSREKFGSSVFISVTRFWKETGILSLNQLVYHLDDAVDAVDQRSVKVKEDFIHKSAIGERTLNGGDQVTELQVGPVLADKGGQGAVLAGAHHQRCGAAHETAQVAAGDQGAILARTTTTTSFFNSQSSVITFVNFITRTTTTTTSCSSTSDASGVVESLSKPADDDDDGD
ncbi:hypothetical protein TYRP_006454 [Tyrophagus putrescentiae]|nr:hypothetical protein TYRP_006454 [Tyrophagus putrescentiae]